MESLSIKLALDTTGVVLIIFLVLILAYCIGRMFGMGFFKSLEDRFKSPTRSEDHYGKGEKKHETE